MHIGWRRCGTYFYKPTMYSTCCPQFTIRLEAAKFTPSKKQRQVLRRAHRFLREEAAASVAETNADPLTVAPTNTDTCAKISPSKPTRKKGNSKSSHSNTTDVETPDALLVECVPPAATPERFDLYKRYQMAVHGDQESKITMKGFKNFLVDSPLTSRPDDPDILENIRGMKSTSSSSCSSSSSSPSSSSSSSSSTLFDQGQNHPIRYGTFHMLYRRPYDRRLVAVSVLDVLPSGISSVYCLYDPDCSRLALGKYTALHEIDWCRRVGLPYYYLGYYIHNCSKMAYKADYQPSDLLCPVGLTWHPYASVSALLTRSCRNFMALDPKLGFLEQFWESLNSSVTASRAIIEKTAASRRVERLEASKKKNAAKKPQQKNAERNNGDEEVDTYQKGKEEEAEEEEEEEEEAEEEEEEELSSNEFDDGEESPALLELAASKSRLETLFRPRFSANSSANRPYDDSDSLQSARLSTEELLERIPVLIAKGCRPCPYGTLNFKDGLKTRLNEALTTWVQLSGPLLSGEIRICLY
jgi:arginyl-tRNA--protein-N-Asp/Glu arginylyltransferase